MDAYIYKPKYIRNAEKFSKMSQSN